MSRSETKRVLKYINTGSVSKLRNFIKKHDVDLNKIHDSEGRSVLHLACYLGSGKITRCLLRCGANPCVTDVHGNTPLHTALEYTLEFNNESAFLELVLPLKKKSKRVMHLKNEQGHTPEELLMKLKEALRQDLSVKEELKIDEEEDDKMEEEREWLEKLAFENSCVDFYFKVDSPPQEERHETYDEWADRIRREYNAKRTRVETRNSRQTLQEKAKQKERESHEELTKKLAKEHEEYMEGVRLKAKAARLAKEREEYEQKCEDVFDKQSVDLLTFWDIPWPSHGSAVDIVEKLSEWAGDREKIKYLKSQQIRWHPDRFLQRCRHRMREKDKERIMDLVKQVSQGINALISSLQ